MIPPAGLLAMMEALGDPFGDLFGAMEETARVMRSFDRVFAFYIPPPRPRPHARPARILPQRKGAPDSGRMARGFWPPCHPRRPPPGSRRGEVWTP